ncbi:MAG: isochorismatase family cysteine hydrolase [bacterium]
MKKALLVIDVQQFFINDSSKFLPIKIAGFLQKNKFDFVYFFKFANSENSNWVKVQKWNKMINSDEQEVANELKPFLKSDNVFVKESNFSVFSIKAFNNILERNEINELFICGMDSDACVYVSAMEAFARGFDVKVLEDLCAASHGNEYHKSAIKMLQRNLGESTVISSEIL